MRERGRGACFAYEAFTTRRIARVFRRKRFERDCTAQPLVLSLIYDAHSATADFREDPIVPDLFAGQRGIVTEGKFGIDGPGGLVEKFGRPHVTVQQRLHFTKKLPVARGRGLYVGFARCRVVFECGVEDLVDLSPTLLVHACELPSSSRASQADATVQCRLTVAGEISIASAVSSTVSPPKNRSSTSRA